MINHFRSSLDCGHGHLLTKAFGARYRTSVQFNFRPDKWDMRSGSTILDKEVNGEKLQIKKRDE